MKKVSSNCKLSKINDAHNVQISATVALMCCYHENHLHARVVRA